MFNQHFKKETKVEAPKVEAPKVEVPKVEIPKQAELPKVDNKPLAYQRFQFNRNMRG